MVHQHTTTHIKPNGSSNKFLNYGFCREINETQQDGILVLNNVYTYVTDESVVSNNVYTYVTDGSVVSNNVYAYVTDGTVISNHVHTVLTLNDVIKGT